ncbi:MAG TPA: hypothetical protein DEA71_17395 [Nitrospira sp.]|nr:hypothetical protein [Nitrospira sp.]
MTEVESKLRWPGSLQVMVKCEVIGLARQGLSRIQRSPIVWNGVSCEQVVGVALQESKVSRCTSDNGKESHDAW